MTITNTNGEQLRNTSFLQSAVIRELDESLNKCVALHYIYKYKYRINDESLRVA